MVSHMVYEPTKQGTVLETAPLMWATMVSHMV